jgi:hypothetical protein
MIGEVFLCGQKLMSCQNALDLAVGKSLELFLVLLEEGLDGIKLLGLLTVGLFGHDYYYLSTICFNYK